MMDEANALSDLDQLRSRYDVLRQLGRDGASAVYATRSRAGDRHFAVKVMDHPGSGSAKGGDLHVWQAQTMRPLEHPKLMALHAVHHLQDGTVAVAMERRRGQTLAERIEAEGPLAATEAESILRHIAEALAYLHGRAIVHRGVRPESIFLDRDTGHARLAPFGIEKEGDGAREGSVIYRAPELVDGKGEVDDRRSSGRSDLYSLGMVGYAMLTGGSRTDELPRLADVREDAPMYLCAAIEGCLLENPRRRWKSIEEFVAALNPAAAGVGSISSLDRVRAGLESGIAALRGVLGDQPAGGARVRIAVAFSSALLGLVAVAVLWGSGPPAGPRDGGTGADANNTGSPAEFAMPRQMVPANAKSMRPPPRPSMLTVDDLVREPADLPVQPLIRTAAAETSPATRPSPSPPTRRAEPSAPRQASGGLVLLGEPITRESSSDLLGSPLRTSTRR